MQCCFSYYTGIKLESPNGHRPYRAYMYVLKRNVVLWNWKGTGSPLQLLTICILHELCLHVKALIYITLHMSVITYSSYGLNGRFDLTAHIGLRWCHVTIYSADVSIFSSRAIFSIMTITSFACHVLWGIYTQVGLTKVNHSFAVIW